MYKHKEAFCLMRYECKNCGHREVVWNSRDGVTPFCLGCPACGTLNLNHVQWDLDKCVPDHVPHRGQRMFIDLTPEKIQKFVDEAIKRGMPKEHEKVYKDQIHNVDLMINGYERLK